MTFYRFPDKPIWKVLTVLYIALVLFLVRDSRFTFSFLNFNQSQYLLFAVTLLFALVFLIVNRKNLKGILTDSRMVAIAVSAVLFVVPMLIKRDWQLMYLTTLFALLIGILLSYLSDLRQMAKYYAVLMAVLGGYSVLATYILRIPADMGLWNVPVMVNSFDAGFYWFGLSFTSVDFVSFRNFGIFREPGVYQFFLLLALFLTNYVTDWEKPWQYWVVNAVLAITMVTTFATGGVIEMGLLAVVVFFDKKFYKDRRIRIVVYVLIAMMAALVAYSCITRNSVYWALYDMFSKLFTKHESTMDRFGSIAVNVRMFLEHPLFGGTIYDTLHAIDHNTSSSGIIFAMFGIFCGLWHVLGWLLLAWERGRSLWLTGILALIMAMSFNTCNVVADAYLWIFPMMAICEKGLPLLSGLGKKIENQE